MKNHLRALWAILFLCSLQAGANTQGRVSLSQENFVSPDYRATDKKSFQHIGVGVDTLGKFKNESDITSQLHAQIDANIAPGANLLNYLNVSQLFWKQNSLVLGRKKMLWSEIDQSYSLGLYQPNFSWNVLQPEAQGLTGLFLNVEAQDTPVPVGVNLFASFVSIPDQGASYEIKDGQFEASSPYFRTPPTSAEMNGQKDSILYNLQKPKTEEVVLQQSFAAKAYLGDSEDGFYGQMAYANKPSNQLTLGFQAFVVPGNAIATDLLPATYYHRLLSGDMQYTLSGISLGISALQESIEEPKYSSEWTYAKYSGSQLYSPYFKLKFKNFSAKLAYLQLSGGEKKAVGPNAGLADAVLPHRHAYSNAYLMDVSYQHRFRKFQALLLTTKYLTGEKSEFAIWTMRGSYQWQERWSAFFESQLASVENTAAGKSVTYHAYMNNDTASIGVQHVF